MLNSVIYDSRWAAAACWLLQSNTELSRCHSHRNAWDHHHPALNYFLLLFLRGGLMRIVNEFGTSKGGNQWQEENDSSIMITFTILHMAMDILIVPCSKHSIITLIGGQQTISTLGHWVIAQFLQFSQLVQWWLSIKWLGPPLSGAQVNQFPARFCAE